MKTTGMVTKINGMFATVETVRTNACDKCHTKQFCITCGKKSMTVSAKNAAGALPGDTVELESPSGTILGYAAVVFVMPIVIALLAYIIGCTVTTSESVPYIISFCAFLGCFVAIFFIFNSKKVKTKNPFTIVKIVDKDINE